MGSTVTLPRFSGLERSGFLGDVHPGIPHRPSEGPLGPGGTPCVSLGPTSCGLFGGDGGRKPVRGRIANAKNFGWAIYAAGFAIWLFGYLSAGHAPLFDWNAATPWWISSFVPNLEAELGLALVREHDPDFTLGSPIPFRGPSSLRGRDARVVGIFGVVDLALIYGQARALMRTFPSINRALIMLCDHPGTKGVTTFLVNHVNRASHLRSATNGAMPPQGHAASRSQHDPARVLALVGSTLGLAARIANLQTTP
jgi:hypothetical protein